MKLKLIILSTFYIFFIQNGYAEQIVLINPPAVARGVNVKVTRIEGVPYFSIQDIAAAYNVRTYFRKETGKIVLYFPDTKIKLSAASSFMMFDEQMVQMTHPVLLIGKDLWAPVYSFMELLKVYAISDLQYTIVDGSVQYRPEKYVETTSEAKADELYPVEIKRETAGRIQLTDIRFEGKANGIIMMISTTGTFTDADLSYFFKGDNWFYLTVYGADCDSEKISKNHPFASIGRVDAISQANSVQISLKLLQKFTSSDVHYDKVSGQIIVSLFFPLNKDILKKIEEAKTAWKIDTIVLDAGHGGKDSGTPGRWGYDHEKDIALDIVLRLGRLLERRDDVKVVYTRDRDVFIPLWKRTEIANKSGGKLFLSFHINASPNRSSAEGIELYLLSQGEKSKDAVEVAQLENSVIQLEGAEDKEKYKGYDDFSYILANMVHSSYMQDSEKLSELVSENFMKMVNQKNRGVKQANFYVLIGASMPKVLLELGYNTNRKEAELLNRPRHRQMIAEALYKSIVKFKELSDKAVEKD